MEIKFRQQSIGWCKVYTWANLLNNPDILRLCDDERFKGCGPEEEDEILREFQPTIKLQTVLAIEASFKVALPTPLIWELIQRDDEFNFCEIQVAPYLLTVRLIESMFHHVAILKYGAHFYYCDPWRKNWMKITTLYEFSHLFKDCWTVQRPVLRDGSQFISFNGEILKWPFLEAEIV